MCGNGIDDGDIAIIKKMLRQGARPDEVDGNGKRAIDVFNGTLQESWAQKVAGQTDKVEEVRALLTPQADMRSRLPSARLQTFGCPLIDDDLPSGVNSHESLYLTI